MDKSMESAAAETDSILKPSNGKSLPKQLQKGQVTIDTFGPNGANRHRFKRKNPQNYVVNETPHEASTELYYEISK